MKTQANARAATDDGPFYRGLIRWAAGLEDGAILRVAFFALLSARPPSSTWTIAS